MADEKQLAGGLATGELEGFEEGFWLLAELVDLTKKRFEGKEGREGFTKYTVVCRTAAVTHYVDYRQEAAARAAIGQAAVGEEFWQQVRLTSTARIYLEGGPAGGPGASGDSIL
jgi:hypothetical protein